MIEALLFAVFALATAAVCAVSAAPYYPPDETSRRPTDAPCQPAGSPGRR